MNLEDPIAKKRSLGALRIAQKTKPRSPDMVGQLQLQRHAAEVIVKQFTESDAEEVVCNIAGWKNDDYRGPFLTVEISPRYVPPHANGSKAPNLDFIFNDQEVRN
jgi:hypothetical protein